LVTFQDATKRIFVPISLPVLMIAIMGRLFQLPSSGTCLDLIQFWDENPLNRMIEIDMLQRLLKVNAGKLGRLVFSTNDPCEMFNKLILSVRMI
jgi:hypothetical protein